MERLVRRSLKDGTRFFQRSAASHTQNSRFSTSASSSPGRMASRRLYRILQRQCLDLKKNLPAHPSGETMVLLQPALHPRQSGTHRILSMKSVSPDEDDVRHLLVFFRDWNEDNDEEDASDWFGSIQNLRSRSEDDEEESEVETPPTPILPNMEWDFTDESTLWATVSSIQRAVRHAFRNSILNADDERPRMNKYAIRAVQLLLEQSEMLRLSSFSYDQNVRVVATTRHIGNSQGGGMMMGGPKNRFNYRIRIENLSDQDAVQLLGRRWLIEDLGVEGVEEVPPQEDSLVVVDAPNSGAVGQLPVLRPGEAFEYMSGCELTTSRGQMSGSFHFAKVPMNTPSATLQNTVPEYGQADRFEVAVQPFPLEAIPE